jgi:hypothetical protein
VTGKVDKDAFTIVPTKVVIPTVEPKVEPKVDTIIEEPKVIEPVVEDITPKNDKIVDVPATAESAFIILDATGSMNAKKAQIVKEINALFTEEKKLLLSAIRPKKMQW